MPLVSENKILVDEDDDDDNLDDLRSRFAVNDNSLVDDVEDHSHREAIIDPDDGSRSSCFPLLFERAERR